ncbi:MAG: urease accessory protein [Actinomycetota bacterium]|jgi:urease accessory protein|nr:urease accessory protein [Actinomycetota bacterium]
MTATAALLLLADSRLPAGGHAHSGGVEQAVSAGRVGDIVTLERFLRGRLATAGAQAATVAAFACLEVTDRGASGPAGGLWSDLDTEVSARMPSPAQRAVSRAQGRALLRVVAAAWPSPVVHRVGARPHHAVALGVAVALAGGTARDAALVAATGAVGGPASAALRLLGTDPVELTALLARLAPELDRCAARSGADAVAAAGDPARLPAPNGPLLDVLAERHASAEGKLFAS